jgi:feruloyl-CoA synthase
MFNAGSSMPETLWQRLKAVAADVADDPIPLTSGFGSTETAPTVTTAHEPSPPYGGIGTPMPGVTVKLVPSGEKLEARVKGPNVFPGYYEDEVATAAAFDDEGFFRTGDALSLIDPGEPSAGMLFGGRLGENFKLMSGTWVSVGSLRTRLLAHVDALADAVIAGADKEYVAALAWVAPGAARSLLGSDAEVEIDDPALRRLIADGLGSMGEKAGASGRVDRLLLLKDPPSLERGEITDKGYINQRRVLERRASEVARLYAEAPDSGVILAGEA